MSLDPSDEALMKIIVSIEQGSPITDGNLWHPKYGWVLRNGKPTRNIPKRYKEMIRRKQSNASTQ